MSQSVLKSASLMGLATFCSRIMGLVREQVFAYLFGASDATDAFNVAFRIPNLLRDLFAEGAMSASLVPTFTRVRALEGDDRAWRVAGLVFRVLTVVVGGLALLGVLFAPQLVGLYASAYREIPGKFELTVRMTRVIFPFFPLVALAAAFMGILNACGVFFMPAFASALFNVGSVLVGGSLSLLFFKYGSEWGVHPIEGMAIGVVAGGMVQALCQVPALYRTGYHWVGKSTLSWYRDPGLRSMLWMMIPGTIGLAATQVNILVNTILATSQGHNAVSWLNYAFRLMQFPIGIFGVSLAAATLPRVSRQWVDRDAQGVAATLSKSLKNVMAINLPASAGLAFLGGPIIQLLFEQGRFTPQDTEATATALAVYALGLTAYSAVKVLVPACYALGNTRIPTFSSLFAVALTIVLNLIMVRRFGFWGLALGTSAAAVVNALFLLWAIQSILRAHSASLGFKSLLRGFFGQLGVALSMGIVCGYSHRFLALWMPESAFMGVRIVRVGLVVLEGAIWVLFLGKVLGLHETSEVFDLFWGKVKKKLRPKRT